MLVERASVSAPSSRPSASTVPEAEPILAAAAEHVPVPVEQAEVQSASVATAVPPQARVDEPAIDLETVLRASGLVMIETSPDKVHASPSVEPELPRGHRERRPPPPDLGTPLVQVETRKQENDTAAPS